MEFKKVIKTRASIKKFSSKKPSMDLIIELIENANLAPAPGNLPLLQYIVVEDPDQIDKVAEACQQDWIKQAPYAVIFMTLPKKAELLYEERADRYMRHHAGAAIENFLLKAVDLGLASCWVGAFSDLTLKNIFGIPKYVQVEAVLPVGFQHPYDKTTQRNKVRLGERIFFGSWKNKFRKPFIKIRRKGAI